jgi:anaerobic magnesium-protoporphyrin IX monomethyl ester cyclase
MRTRSPESVVAELSELSDRYQLASFLFHDDCLFHNRGWIQNFTHLYRQADLKMHFFIQSRADLLIRNRDLLPALRAVGLRGVFIGFESGSQRMLDLLRKGTRVEDNVHAAQICKENKIAIWANYMLGIPTETLEDVQATVEMIRNIDPDYYSPAFYTPQPGTELGRYVQEQGLSLITGYDELCRNPDKPKIRGVDYSFLQRAMDESKRRKPYNSLRRSVVHFSSRVLGKIKRLSAGNNR